MKYKTLTELQEQLNGIQKELDSMKQEWPNPERVRGEWYVVKHNIYDDIGHSLRNFQSLTDSFGVNHSGSWSGDFYLRPSGWTNWRKATPSEVKEMLVKHITELASDGVIKCLHECENAMIKEIEEWEYDMETDYLRYSNNVSIGCAYWKGEFATILPAEKPNILIAGHAVEILSNIIRINRTQYRREAIQLLHDAASIHKCNVSIMGSVVAAETLKEILKRMGDADYYKRR